MTRAYAQSQLECFVSGCKEPIWKAVETGTNEWFGICATHCLKGEKFHTIDDNFNRSLCGRRVKENRLVGSADVTCYRCQRINDGI